MYKVFINTVPVILTTQQFEGLPNQSKDKLQVTYHTSKELMDIIRYIEENTFLKTAYIYGENITQLRRDFWANYRLLDAAGGLVFNDRQEVLLIYRSSRWDLPKGKVEKGETLPDTALREVGEETGLGSLTIEAPIFIGDAQQDHTCHTYYERGSRVFKRTYWFKMFCGQPDSARPQIEEGITEVRWVPVNALRSGGYLDNTFGNIREILIASGA